MRRKRPRRSSIIVHHTGIHAVQEGYMGSRDMRTAKRLERRADIIDERKDRDLKSGTYSSTKEVQRERNDRTKRRQERRERMHPGCF